jgi:hypothetical protein
LAGRKGGSYLWIGQGAVEELWKEPLNKKILKETTAGVKTVQFAKHSFSKLEDCRRKATIGVIENTE